MNKQSKSYWEKNNIKPGAKIKQKDVIGFVGSTGLATGLMFVIDFGKMENK